jgi:hypothetical protein
MSRVRELLTWLGFVEAQPRGPSLPTWIYLSLGVIATVLGIGLIASGEPAIGAVIAVLGVVNLGLAVSTRHRGQG